MGNEGFTEVVCSERHTDVYTKCHGNPSNGCQDTTLEITNVNHMGIEKERLGD